MQQSYLPVLLLTSPCAQFDSFITWSAMRPCAGLCRALQQKVPRCRGLHCTKVCSILYQKSRKAPHMLEVFPIMMSGTVACGEACNPQLELDPKFSCKLIEMKCSVHTVWECFQIWSIAWVAKRERITIRRNDWREVLKIGCLMHRQWSWPIPLPPQAFGIFSKGTLEDSDQTTPWAEEIEQKVFASSVGMSLCMRHFLATSNLMLLRSSVCKYSLMSTCSKASAAGTAFRFCHGKLSYMSSISSLKIGVDLACQMRQVIRMRTFTPSKKDCIVTNLNLPGFGPYSEVAFFHKQSKTLLVTDAVVQIPASPPEVGPLFALLGELLKCYLRSYCALILLGTTCWWAQTSWRGH